MSKHGINVPKGVAVSSIDEVKKAIQDVFPNETEVIFGNLRCYCVLIYFVAERNGCDAAIFICFHYS